MKRSGAAEIVLDGMEMAKERGLEETISALEDLHRKMSDALLTAARNGESTTVGFFGDGKEWFQDLDEAITALKGMR